MSKIVNIRNADDPRDVIHRAVELLTGGELVAFPTETAYVVAAHALKPKGVQKLLEIVGVPAGEACGCVLGVKGLQEARDYIPHMSLMGRKLARRCWPGPVTLQFDVANQEGKLHSLPQDTLSAVSPNGSGVCLRTPAHDVILETLRLIPAPLVLSPEETSQPLAASADDVSESVGENLSLIIDDGECRYNQSSTVVRIVNNQWEVVRPGVMTESMISRLASEVYLFVCTGNTCRSPLAEGLFRKLLAERLKCSEEELPRKGFVLDSAGLSATIGSPASPESIEIAGKTGVDLGTHVSQPVTDRLLELADHIYTMTGGHRESILAARPDLADRVHLLSRTGEDIPDPMGRGMNEYEECEREIEKHLRALLDEIKVQDES